MTTDEKRAAIRAAWDRYRAAHQAIPRHLPFSAHKRHGVMVPGVVELDADLFRAYLSTEREIERA